MASAVLALSAAGQLAITEVMSSPSTNRVQVDDFWELTNFGAEAIDLSSYTFRDSGGFTGSANLGTLWQATRGEEPPLIGPGESVIWVRSRPDIITTPGEFRAWWGEARLPSNLKIILYQGFGFNEVEDAVQLWHVTPQGTNLVQRVELFEAVRGRSFAYDQTTGVLDDFSLAGQNGAFVAEGSDDVGSPGVTTGPVAMRLVEAPASVEVDGGTPVTLAVRAQGLPAPRYQWRLHNAPIPGATGPAWTILAAAEKDAGEYTVELRNGLEQMMTPPATLTVLTNPKSPTLARPLADVEVLYDQTACFKVEARGYPLPTFRWQFNGLEIPGATDSILTLPNVDENQAGLYTVYVTNPIGSTNSSAWLRVAPQSSLLITEAMASPSTNTVTVGHEDWWEVTNIGAIPVDLRGYRWDDKPPSLEDAVAVADNFHLPPGDSAIFVSGMSPEAFRRWWGEENLPERLPIVSYYGNSIAALGDLVVLWSASACRDEDVLFSYGVLDQSVPLTQGRSLECDLEFLDCGIPSVAGQRGAFQAVESDDVGSPGWTSNEQRAAPRYLSIRPEGAGFELRWKSEPGRTYTVQHSEDPAALNWNALVTLPATGPWLTAPDVPAATTGRRFYRVLLKPLGP